MKSSTLLLFVIALCLIINFSCKKDETTPASNNNNNQNNTCNFTTNVLAIDGTTKNVVSDSCRTFGSNYYTEHFADAGRTEAVAIIFNGTSLPAAGNYTAVNDFSSVDATHVYVEYYTSADAYQPSTGTVTVSESGTSRTYTFCNLSCTNGTSTKSVSLRSVCN